jgi:hypothetical protein
MPDSQNYQDIKALMDPTPKAMKAKYDKDGDGTDPLGSRKMWPMVLGHSPPGNQEIVLVYQINASPAERGWRCMKVVSFVDGSIEETNPGSNPRPVITEDDVARQSCVTNTELPTFP